MIVPEVICGATLTACSRFADEVVQRRTRAAVCHQRRPHPGRGREQQTWPAGSASSLTGTIVFQRLGVEVEQVLYDNPTALQKLKTGELAALVRVIGKPIDFFAKIPANSGLHFVPIPFSKAFTDYYTVGELTGKE